MRPHTLVLTFGVVAIIAWAAVDSGRFVAQAQQELQPAAPAVEPADAEDPVRVLVGRLELEKYKATLKGLTQFGDRRQGTERNRKAIDWIQAQLESYGCPTDRIKYEFVPRSGRGGAGRGGAAAGTGRGAAAAGRGGGQGGGRGQVGPVGKRPSSGGSMIFGNVGRTGVNNDPIAQPDETLRALNAEPAPDGPGPREEVYCTKVGTTRPDEMYIIGAHMDGHGWGEAADDDGSGTALVMEIARVLNSPDVQTERSIRFALWNNEETGLNGARAYVEQRQARQGKEDPPGSGKYAEPRWLGMIQHDMMLWDHGMPDENGRVSPEQRREADVNIEFQSTAKRTDEAMKLAFFFKAANEKYATDYPATVGPHMTNTDSGPFMDLIPAISLRENERGAHTGAGWNPHWHQPTDVFSTYSDKDFRLGLNAAQTTLAAIAQLTGAAVKKTSTQ